MSKEESLTREKIVFAALGLFSEVGIAKTSVFDVAFRAGVTRVTVYRYFADKQALVRETYLFIEQVFQRGLEELEQDPQADWESVMKRIGEGLSALPETNPFAGFDELARLYPDVYEAVQEVRVRTLNGIFEHIAERIRREGQMRPGLNRELVQAVFWEMTINIFENPRLKASGLSGAELYRALLDILLYGILKS
jgi:AcrR family transcriptional regulator